MACIVDSGLPDFRGNEGLRFEILFILFQNTIPLGFWKAYPPLAELGIGFQQMANPQWFETNPELAWCVNVLCKLSSQFEFCVKC